MTSRGQKVPGKSKKAVASDMAPTEDQMGKTLRGQRGDTREREYIMSYLGLAVAMIGFLVITWGNWGKSLDYSVTIVAILIVIAYFVLCSISIGLRKRSRIGWMKYHSRVAMQTEFGHLSLFLGLLSLGIALMYSHQILLGVLAILVGYAVLGWGIGKQGDGIQKGA